MSSPFRSNVIPSFLNTLGITPRLSQETFLIVISLFVIAARPIQEPISIMSGRILCSQPPRESTPSIVSKLDPTPLILAPIEFNILHNCCK